jgi:hypothetical protein
MFSPELADNRNGEVCHAGVWPSSPPSRAGISSRGRDLALSVFALLGFGFSCHSPLVSYTLFLNNSLYFHQHRGEMDISSLFLSNIVASLKSGIFSTFVFNDIVGLTFIFSPRIFRYPGAKKKLTIMFPMT